MALNGISTLPNKEDRKFAKIALAEAKRQNISLPGYREYNVYIGTVSPEIGRPWSQFSPVPHEATFDAENGDDFITEDDITLVTE